MPRYFIEVAYKGTNYKGFQIQENANSVQAEVQRALELLFRQSFQLTGSSRTDAGVHALRNYFHFDAETGVKEQQVYNLNALLPSDIVIKKIFPVDEKSHCRFSAISREYEYHIYWQKNPFLEDRAYYYPFKLDFDLLQEAAKIIFNYNDFTSFSKRNTQVKTFICNISKSEWELRDELLVYRVQSNRFLRGMVKALVGTMLKVGRKQISLDELKLVIEARDCAKADFSAPSRGLFLMAVNYPEEVLHFEKH